MIVIDCFAISASTLIIHQTSATPTSKAWLRLHKAEMGDWLPYSLDSKKESFPHSLLIKWTFNTKPSYLTFDIFLSSNENKDA